MKRSSISKALLASALLFFSIPAISTAQPNLTAAFPYQGSLADNGIPANGLYDFRFTLFDDANFGASVGNPVVANDVNVTNGVFTVSLDFGNAAFAGQRRWLQTEVAPDGQSYETLSPRLEIQAQPYSQFALNAENVVNDNVDDADNDPTNEHQTLLFVPSLSELAITNGNTANLSGLRLSSLYRPDAGLAAMNVVDAAGNVAVGDTVANGRLKVKGGSGTSHILEVEDALGTDVFLVREDGRVGIGQTASDSRLIVRSQNTDAVVMGLSTSTGRSVLQVDNDGDIEVFNEANNAEIFEISGANYNTGIGAAPFNNVQLRVKEEESLSNDATIMVVQDSSNNTRLQIDSDGFTRTIGAYEVTGDFYVTATSNRADLFRIEADVNPSAFFQVDTFVDGDFSVANGTKNFVIDHPIDPASKELYHNAVEGPGHYTFYQGVVVVGNTGSATVTLPDYFTALNHEVRYQLTPIGAAMPNLHVSEEVSSNNEFEIGGGVSGKKVSWQVTAERNDPWAQDHPYVAEREKSEDKEGRYHYPQGYNQSTDLSLKRNLELREPFSSKE